VVPFFASIGITVAALVLLFIFVFPPVTILCAVTGPLAPIIAGVLCVLMSGLISFIGFQVLFSRATTEIKLYAMEEQGVSDWMMDKYGIRDVPDVGMVADVISTLRFLFMQVFMAVWTSPLNVTPPGLGTIAFCLVNGWLMTWESVSDLLPMIGYRTCLQQCSHLGRHLISYISFGFSAFGLMLIPVVNVLFGAGIAYGAAILFGHYVKEGRIGPAGIPLANNKDNNDNTGTE